MELAMSNTDALTPAASRFPAKAVWLVALLFCGVNAIAADRTWLNPVSGNYSDGTKWTAGVVPNGDEGVYLNNYTNNSAFTITLTAAVTNTRMQYLDAPATARNTTTLDLSGYGYAVTNTGIGGPDALFVNRFGGAGKTIILQVTNSAATAATFEVQRFTITGVANGLGMLNLAGSNTVLQARKSDHYIGYVGVGELNVKNDATLLWQGAPQIGAGVTGVGTLRVSRATMNCNEAISTTLFLPRRGRGMWLIEAGSSVGITNTTVKPLLYMGDGAPDSITPSFGCYGELLVTDSSVMTNYGSVTVGSIGSARITARGGSTLHSTGQLTMGDGKAGYVYSSSTNENRYAYGSLLATDSGTLVHFDGAAYIGLFGYADCTVSNGATMRVRHTNGTQVDDRSSLTVANARYESTKLTTVTNSTLGFMLGDIPKTTALIALSNNLVLANPTTLKLTVLPSATLNAGDTVTLLTYAGSRTGTFLGLPEGAAFFASGRRFRIYYGDGSNDAITLKVTPMGSTVLVY